MAAAKLSIKCHLVKLFPLLITVLYQRSKEGQWYVTRFSRG